jgi:hypothetical protein
VSCQLLCIVAVVQHELTLRGPVLLNCEVSAVQDREYVGGISSNVYHSTHVDKFSCNGSALKRRGVCHIIRDPFGG